MIITPEINTHLNKKETSKQNSSTRIVKAYGKYHASIIREICNVKTKSTHEKCYINCYSQNKISTNKNVKM